MNFDETAEMNYEYKWVCFFLCFVNLSNCLYSRPVSRPGKMFLWAWLWELTGIDKELNVDSNPGNPTPTMVGVIVRCFMSMLVNEGLRNEVLVNLPLFLMKSDSRIDHVKACLAIAFITDIDDLSRQVTLKVKGDSWGDVERAGRVGNEFLE
ncbi:unnamed protein product [Prorocentrum cordatum]|uniref:Uncharacterized protein n=1 Tax=Prorocentrum cordatum TaxID=2364126 RepID=A0ABN9UMT3_9DINO|nr:unnamed protein product [Polarella glacialis]